MGKVAFVFPGQGSQYVGMGKETHDAFSGARDVFIEADVTLGFSLSKLCFRGPEDTLGLTEFAQPAILTASIAIWRVLRDRGFAPDYVAGHGVGEYSALVCAGSLTLSHAVQAVRKRGKYMQEAVPAGRGGMAVVFGLDAAVVRAVCAEASGAGVVAPAYYNAPGQTVIAGEAGALRKASELAKQKGAKRVLPLPVAVPFHCGLMASARDRLAEDLLKLHFYDLQVPLITNADATEAWDAEKVRESLIRQVCSPVHWKESVEYLIEKDVDTFIEVGPGKVLAGLVKHLAPQARTHNVDGIRGIEALASVIPSAKM